MQIYSDYCHTLLPNPKAVNFNYHPNYFLQRWWFPLILLSIGCYPTLNKISFVNVYSILADFRLTSHLIKAITISSLWSSLYHIYKSIRSNCYGVRNRLKTDSYPPQFLLLLQNIAWLEQDFVQNYCILLRHLPWTWLCKWPIGSHKDCRSSYMAWRRFQINRRHRYCGLCFGFMLCSFVFSYIGRSSRRATFFRLILF